MVPSSYTEVQLAEYMVSELASSGLSLTVTVASLAEAVYTALFVYGVTDIADASDMQKLRTIARAEAWKYALATAGEEIFDRVLTNYKIAARDAQVYAPNYAVEVSTITYTNDPYGVHKKNYYFG